MGKKRNKRGKPKRDVTRLKRNKEQLFSLYGRFKDGELGWSRMVETAFTYERALIIYEPRLELARKNKSIELRILPLGDRERAFPFTVSRLNNRSLWD